MVKPRYNWRARQVADTIVDNSSTKEIKLDLKVKGSYDESNELVLPSLKRKTKIKKDKTQVTKILSKKQRKRLEKIVDKKKKKENRAALLESLQNVQVESEELAQLTSISAVQTIGLRKYQLSQSSKIESNATQCPTKQLDSIKGAYKKKWRQLKETTEKKKNYGPNVLGFNSSDSDDVTSSEDEGDKSSNNEKSDNKSDELSNIKIEDSEEDAVEISNAKIDIIEIRDDHESKDISEETKTDTKKRKAPQKNNVSKKKQKLEANIESEPTLKKSKEINKNESNNCVSNDQAPLSKNKTTGANSEKITEEAPKKENIPRKPAVYVDVIRTKEIQAARLKLPILAEEQHIMEVINENSIVIVAGATGSGKTTQLPQFLYEAGYARNKQIGITEPRRVAAIAMSKRVAEEMNLSAEEVSYLIRFEGNVTEKTKIKFMTDGVLLAEMKKDFLLSKYSVIILDEAHERSEHTDILLGFLSRIVPWRLKKNNPLKLIIMSATLKLTDFIENSKLFKSPPPVINVEARQFPVTIHFNKTTNENYVKEAYRKAVKIHTTLPEGGILIFLTGQQEVNQLVRKLRNAFPLKRKNQLLENDEDENKTAEQEESDDSFDDEWKTRSRTKRSKMKIIPNIDLDDYDIQDKRASDEEEEPISDEEGDTEDVTVYRNAPALWTLPLYSMLPSELQQKVFQLPPNGCRLCIVSTNIAETSLTIPNIKYVIDSGKTKLQLHDKVTGLTKYDISWTSKASANQRAGRAGRTGPGHCYRLYSSAVFNNEFAEYTAPQIQLRPIDDLYLRLSAMKMNVEKFPFPNAPDENQMREAKRRLQILGAMNGDRVTSLGQDINKLPVLPRYGKILVESKKENLLPYTILLVAALSVKEVLMETPPATVADQKIADKWSLLRKRCAGQGECLLLGDMAVLLKEMGAADCAYREGNLKGFCNRIGLRYKAVIEVRKLRKQLTTEIRKIWPEVQIEGEELLVPPTDDQYRRLRRLVLCGMGDHVARKIHDRTDPKLKDAYQTMSLEEPVFFHRSSVLLSTKPEFVVYQEIFETKKILLRGITAVDASWLPELVPDLCSLAPPLTDPLPYYSKESGKVRCFATGTFGPRAWPIPTTDMEYPKGKDFVKENVKWFAKFLLAGEPFKKLEKYESCLLSKPVVVIKNWAMSLPRVKSLLQQLLAKEVVCKQTLEKEWLQNPKYLLREYLEWVPDSKHSEIEALWPPIE